MVLTGEADATFRAPEQADDGTHQWNVQSGNDPGSGEKEGNERGGGEEGVRGADGEDGEMDGASKAIAHLQRLCGYRCHPRAPRRPPAALPRFLSPCFSARPVPPTLHLCLHPSPAATLRSQAP